MQCSLMAESSFAMVVILRGIESLEPVEMDGSSLVVALAYSTVAETELETPAYPISVSHIRTHRKPDLPG
jgi:hypothetical protein